MNIATDKSIKKYFLYPASIYFSIEPMLVTTILGSCIAVCIYDKIMQYGGINHFMLPLWNGQGLASPKYGNIAIIKLIEKLIANGSQKNKLVAKIFGGADIINTDVKKLNTSIGDNNIQFAYECLAEEGIPIIASSTGGTRGRKIMFNTSTGEVKQYYIASQHIR